MRKIICLVLMILVFNVPILAKTDSQEKNTAGNDIPEVIERENCVIKNGKTISLKPKPISITITNTYNHPIIVTAERTKEHINDIEFQIEFTNYFNGPIETEVEKR